MSEIHDGHLADVIPLHDRRKEAFNYADFFQRPDVVQEMLEFEEAMDKSPDLTVFIEEVVEHVASDPDSVLALLIDNEDGTLPWKQQSFKKTYALHNPAVRKAQDIARELIDAQTQDGMLLAKYTRLYRCMCATIFARIARDDYRKEDVEWEERAHKIFRPKLGDFTPIS